MKFKDIYHGTAYDLFHDTGIPKSTAYKLINDQISIKKLSFESIIKLNKIIQFEDLKLLYENESTIIKKKPTKGKQVDYVICRSKKIEDLNFNQMYKVLGITRDYYVVLDEKENQKAYKKKHFSQVLKENINGC